MIFSLAIRVSSFYLLRLSIALYTLNGWNCAVPRQLSFHGWESPRQGASLVSPPLFFVG